MQAPDTYTEGRPSWVDLATSKPEAAKEFYSKVFGWDYETQGSPDGGSYFMARSGGHVVAGLAKGQDPNFPPTWSTYIAVDDAQATVDKARAAGGNVMVEPTSVGPAGTMAYVADPAGAAFGLWQGDVHEGAARINEPGAYTWAELFCPDADAAGAFYNATVGLKAEAMDFGADQPYTMFKLGDRVVGGTMPPPMEGVPNHWHVYFGSADTDATCAAATEAGGKVVAGPIDTPVGRMATIKDPQGATFSVIALNEWPE